MQELAHALSNGVGLQMDHLMQTLNPKLTPKEVLDRVTAALEISMRGKTDLMKLMWELGQIADPAGLKFEYRPPGGPPLG